MAEFGAEVSNFPTLSSSVSPQAGVVKATPFFEGVASVFDQAGEMLTKKREAKSVGVLAEFTNKQLAIADAVDQGVYNSRHAQTLLRKNLMEAIAANPLIAKDLVASQSSIVGLAGGADIVKEGNDQERRQRLRYDAMVSSGFMPADTSDEDAKRYDLALQESEEASRRHKLRMETIDEKLKLNTLSSSERTRLNEERQGEANRYVRDSSEATSMYLSTKFSSILASDMSEGEKEMAIEDEYNKWFSETSTILGQASSQEAEYMLKPIQGLKDTYLKRARGEIGDAEVKRGTDRALALQKALVLADPAVARTVAATELLGADAFVKALGMSDGVIKSAFNITEGLSDTSSNAPNFFSEEADFNKASEAVLGSVLENLNSKDEKASTEAKGFLGKIFESIEDNAGTISRDPKKTKGVVDWLSSSAFLKASQENPELFQDIEGAKDVLERNYADEVWGLVEREFKTSEVVIQKTPSGSEMAALMASGPGAGMMMTPAGKVPTVSGVGTRATPSGMEFYVIAGEGVSEEEKAAFESKAKSLNKTLKPVINKNLKAFAHLNGRDDYGAYWSEVADKISGGTGSEDLGGGDAGDNLTMDDFTFPTVSSKGVPEDVKQDTEFLSEVERLSAKYEIPTSVLMAVMDFETGGSFSPSQKNAAGSSGTGLIQFMATTAKSLGTSVEELSNLSRGEQMKYVEKYFDQYADRISGGSARDVYMAVLFPKAIGKADDYVLFSSGTKAYNQNKGLDSNGDGTVTKLEAARSVVKLVGKHEDQE